MQEDHKHLHELISALADGTLTPEEAAQVQVHMKDCPDCRQLLHDIRRIGTAIGEEGVPPVPAHLAGRIRERIAGGSGQTLALSPAVPIWRSPFPLAAAATLLLVSVIWLAWPRGASRSATPFDQESARQNSGVPQSPQGKQVPPSSEKAPVSPKILEHEAPPPEQLRKLGYLVDGGSNEPKPTAQADSLEREYGALKEKSPASAPTPRDQRSGELDRVISSGLTGEDYKKAERQSRADEAPGKDVAAEAPLAAAPGSASTVTEIRSLVYEGPEYSATFVKDGLITIVARGYACSADVPVSKPGAGERGKAVEDLLSLFAAASSKDFIAVAAHGEASAGAEPGQAAAGSSTLTLRDGQGNPVRSINFSDPLPEDAPKNLRGLRQAIGHLIKDRYRSEIEARCGPLPTRIVESP
jgi:anti-sigma factor RsiW